MTELSPLFYCAVSIVFASSFAQGFVGFGYGLLAIPLLTHHCFPNNASASVVICNGTFVFHCFQMSVLGVGSDETRWKDCARVCLFIIPIAFIPFIPRIAWISEWLVARLDTPWFFGVLGIVIILQVALQLAKTSFKLIQKQDTADTPTENNASRDNWAEWLWAAPAGIITGIIAVLFATTGPPLLIYGKLRSWNTTRLRTFLQPVFFAGAAIACVMYATAPTSAAGKAWQMLMLWLATPSSLFFIALAILVGTYLGFKLNERLQRSPRGKHIVEVVFTLALVYVGGRMLLDAVNS